jgi:tetratricopeptide (TPR) repeat protein
VIAPAPIANRRRLGLLPKLPFSALLLALGACAQAPTITTDQQITLYQSWVAKDPSSISNRTLLAGAFIQKTRETTDFGYLDRASKILAGVLSEHQDYEALRLRNVVELTLHHFSNAAEYARAMTVRWPGDVQSWGTLGDAQLEMGQYQAARDAFAKMLELKPGLMSYNRMGFFRFITGDPESGIQLMKKAVDAAAKYPENKAWCLVELGNMYFKTGRWLQAEEAYNQAIATFPSSHAAFAALGAIAAARGNLPDAIEKYKRAQSITPLVQYAGALYDLYIAVGKNSEAAQQADLIDLVTKLEGVANQKANRTISLIYANQNRNLPESLKFAQADFDIRQDVYTYDALAWALYKNQRFEEASRASAEALKLGAPEALFYYHAGMIANAVGNTDAAGKHLEKALELNAGFDFRQSAIARDTLKKMQLDSK